MSKYNIMKQSAFSPDSLVPKTDSVVLTAIRHNQYTEG